MHSAKYFRKLARISLRLSQLITDPELSRRMAAIGEENQTQAEAIERASGTLLPIVEYGGVGAATKID